MKLIGWISAPALVAIAIATAAPVPSRPAPRRVRPAVAATPYPGGTWQPDDARYGVAAVRNVAVSMSDGVRLVGDVFYPANLVTGRRVRERFPVLLTQNPYSSAVFNIGDLAHERYFVPRGYIAVQMDVRGTNRSGGVQTLFGARQAEDGAELVDWAAHRLAGSNGVVGLQGESYLGINQLLTASRTSSSSGLKAIAPLYAGAELYREPLTDGGVPTYFNAGLDQALVLSAHNGDTDIPRHLAQTKRGIGPALYDDEYRVDREPRDLAAAIVTRRVPTLLWSGSADIFPFGSLELYAELQNAAAHRRIDGPMDPRAPTTGRYQLVFGDYKHGDDPGGILETLDLEWFDTWLKHRATGMDRTTSPLHVYEQGDGRWVSARTYPLVGDETTYYLDAGAALTPQRPTRSGQDALAWAAPTAPGGTQRYETPSFPAGATLAGPVSATIRARATTADVELALELDDVAPDGSAIPLTTGALLGSFRAVDAAQSWRDRHGRLVYAFHPFSRSSARGVPPGAIERYDVELAPRVLALAPGHRLRLLVQTDVGQRTMGAAAGSGLAPSDHQRAQLAGGVYEIERGPTSPSLLNLPLLPPAALPSAPHQTPVGWG